MRTRQFGLFAVVAFAVLMTGCGRAVSPGQVERAVGTEENIPVMPAGMGTVVSKDKVRAVPSPVVGVFVDGRYYPKGKEPSATTKPSPAAPEAGKGHVLATVSLANRLSSFVEKLEVTVKPKGKTTAVLVRTYNKKDLVGTKLYVVASNVAPGDYEVSMAVYGKEQAITRAQELVTVESGKTAEVEI